MAEQLKIVARLIKGGLKTKVYTVTIGGFDTHKKQVNASDTTTGNHAKLMKDLSAGISAFQKDLELMQLDDRVLGNDLFRIRKTYKIQCKSWVLIMAPQHH